MITIKQIRTKFRFHPEEVGSSIKYFKNQVIDWDVYLPTKGKNLQRPFVWTIEQKRELIWSILMGRHIPHLAFINTVDDVWHIIDGKQRLSSIFDFIDDKFTIIIDEKEWLFSELPHDFNLAINNTYFRYYVVNEQYNNKNEIDSISDEDKIAWFKFINFSGTPQDAEHLNSLK